MNGFIASSINQGFCRTLTSGAPVPQRPVDLTLALRDIEAKERKARHKASTNMLTTAQTRQEPALQNQHTCNVIGQRVTIVIGQLAERQGDVQYADFIHRRVEIKVDRMPNSRLVSFKCVGSRP